MTPRPDKNVIAGLRVSYPNPVLEGEWVGVYDGVAAHLDTDGGRWQTVCEFHGTICSHETLARAKDFRDPREWCEECMDLDLVPPSGAETENQTTTITRR